MNRGFIMMVLFIFAFSACQNEDDRMRDEIVGTWDVYASEMNNQPNGLMKDAYFTFDDDMQVASNLFQDTGKQTYTIDEGKLSINIPEGFDLAITRLQQDTMWMEGKLSFYYMKYAMVKRKS